MFKYFIFLKCCLPPTETVRTIRDRVPRMSTLTVTQLLNSDACITDSAAVGLERGTIIPHKGLMRC